jgi:hypothetical protein
VRGLLYFQSNVFSFLLLKPPPFNRNKLIFPIQQQSIFPVQQESPSSFIGAQSYRRKMREGTFVNNRDLHISGERNLKPSSNVGY